MLGFRDSGIQERDLDLQGILWSAPTCPCFSFSGPLRLGTKSDREDREERQVPGLREVAAREMALWISNLESRIDES